MKHNVGSVRKDIGVLVDMSNTYCPLIHNGLATSPTGGYRPCCIFDEKWLVRTSLMNYKNSKIFNDIIAAESEGKWHPGCHLCENAEQHGAESKRLREIHNLKNITLQNGKIYLLDLRLGNKCNMACLSCSPKNSSAIYQEVGNAVATNVDYKLPQHFLYWYNKESDFTNPYNDDEILQLLSKVDLNARIYFTGGEPTVIKGVKKCLDKMIELGLHKTIQLEFNSNFLAWNNVWFDRISHFNGLMMASIDDIGPRAEYIRYKTDWELVEANIKKFINDLPSWQTDVVPTISILNILYLDNLIDWCNDINVSFKLTNPLNNPNFLSIRNLPMEAKEKIEMNLQKYKKIRGASDLIKVLQLKPNTKIENIKETLDNMDKLRKTNWKETFPKLVEFIGE